MAVLRLVEVAQRSDTGLVRPHNEDRALAVPPLLVVADGMGGAKAGEVAAQMTIDALAQTGPSPSVDLVVEAIADANREIRELSASDPDHAGMGTTVTGVLVTEAGITAIHVGDSRAYVIRGMQIRQVTNDHSLVAEMVRLGQISPQEAERHPSRNIITRALGAEGAVEVDRIPLGLEADDIVLLCSDGLSTMVDSDEMVRLVRGASSLQRAAEALVEAALAAGGNDNVTVVLGRLADAAAITADRAPVERGNTSEIPMVTAADVSAPPDPDTVELIPQDETNEPAPGEEHEVPAAGAATGPLPRGQDASTGGRAVVLESAARARRPSRRPIVAVVLAALVVLGGLATWAASRVFFVDARHGADTARIYHGLPFSPLGITLHTEWADTGVSAETIRTAESSALSGDAHGEGAAVWVAANLVWRYGLPPTIEVLELPPAAATTVTRKKKTTKSTR